VKEPKIDYQRLSALLEGGVSDREREELLAQLAASGDDFEAYTDTVEILMAVEEEERAAAAQKEDAGAGAAAEPHVSTAGAPPEGVTPLRRPERGPRMARRWPLALAASIAMIGLVTTLTLRVGGYGAAHPVKLAARADTAGARLPEGLDTPGPGIRGEPGSATGNADAVQAGAILVNLAVAARASDTTAVQRLATRLSDAYFPGESPGRPLKRMAADPGASLDALNALLDQATDQLAGTLDRNSLELGMWLQSARLAAYYQNEDFFDGRASNVMLGRAERLARGNATTRAAVDGVRTALPANTPQQWRALQASLGMLLTELAREELLRTPDQLPM
jgi:hypothetical protein